MSDFAVTRKRMEEWTPPLPPSRLFLSLLRDEEA